MPESVPILSPFRRPFVSAREARATAWMLGALALASVAWSALLASRDESWREPLALAVLLTGLALPFLRRARQAQDPAATRPPAVFRERCS